MAVADGARPISLAEEITKPRTPWMDTWSQFVRNKLAVVGLIFVIFIVTLALTADIWKTFGFIEDFAIQHRGSSLAFPMTCAVDNPAGKPSWCFLSGADDLGRDIFSRIIYGTQVSLAVAAVGATVNITMGTIYGIISGFYGGRVDNLMMRVVDFLYGLPDLVIIILMQVFFKTMAAYKDEVGPIGAALIDIDRRMGGLFFVFIAIGLLGWIGVARLARGQILSLKEKEFVEAARSVGASNRRIIFVHLLPNIVGPLIVIAALSVPGFIFTESVLSFLGLGVNPPTPSWGSLIDFAYKTHFESRPYLILAPGIALALTVLAFNFLGDGLRDAFDPRLRGT
jgi:ABC-type dipeptide/oligopeptide/nickel transport system permease subunit